MVSVELQGSGVESVEEAITEIFPPRWRKNFPKSELPKFGCFGWQRGLFTLGTVPKHWDTVWWFCGVAASDHLGVFFKINVQPRLTEAESHRGGAK